MTIQGNQVVQARSVRRFGGMIIDALTFIGLVVLYFLYDWAIERRGGAEVHVARRLNRVRVVRQRPQANRLRLVGTTQRAS